MMHLSVLRAWTIASIIALAGCTTSQPNRLYTLADPPSPSASAMTHPKMAIGIGNISLPEYLDRPQIVTRSSATRMEIAEFDRWVEPLGAMTRRVLLQTLRNELGTDKVVILPQSRAVNVDYQVAVDVTRFDAQQGGDMILDARWVVLSGDSGEILRDGRTVLQLPTGDAPGLQQTVDAMSKAWTMLGVEISQAVAHLAQ